MDTLMRHNWPGNIRELEHASSAPSSSLRPIPSPGLSFSSQCDPAMRPIREPVNIADVLRSVSWWRLRSARKAGFKHVQPDGWASRAPT